MSNTTDIPLTPMQVRLRPSLALRQIEELHAELEQARAGLEHALKENRELEENMAALRRERSSLQASLTEVSLKHRKLEEEHAALVEETGQIEGWFDNVRQMQANYERRLERCKAKIADLRQALAREREAAANADITPLPPPPKSSEPEPTSAEEPPSAEWYRPLDL